MPTGAGIVIRHTDKLLLSHTPEVFWYREEGDSALEIAVLPMLKPHRNLQSTGVLGESITEPQLLLSVRCTPRGVLRPGSISGKILSNQAVVPYL